MEYRRTGGPNSIPHALTMAWDVSGVHNRATAAAIRSCPTWVSIPGGVDRRVPQQRLDAHPFRSGVQ